MSMANKIWNPGRQQVVSPTFHLRKRRRKPVIDVGACPYNLRTAPPLASQDSCVILSDSEDEYQGFDKDKGPEAKGQKYAIMAINLYNKDCSSNFEFVETGPLAAGYIPTGRIMHFNFKAKQKDGPDAPVCTFFSEITKTNRSVVSFHSILFLGPSYLLPEKADTCGCLYCCSHNIHHPDSHMAFQGGRDHIWTTLFSQIKELNTYIQEGFDKAEKEEALLILSSHILESNVALHFFNEKEGTNFEVVNEGPVGTMKSGLGFIYHLNFEAKNKTDPDVPVQTFFAQVIRNRLFFFTEFCKCLGPSNSLPDKVDIHVCKICASDHVHHPPGSGYLIGR